MQLTHMFKLWVQGSSPWRPISFFDPMWYVYIARCSDGTLYTGTTTNPEARLRTHNAGQGSRYVRSRRPAALVYTRACRTRSAACRREAELKLLSRTQKVVLIAKRSTRQRVPASRA